MTPSSQFFWRVLPLNLFSLRACIALRFFFMACIASMEVRYMACVAFKFVFMACVTSKLVYMACVAFHGMYTVIIVLICVHASIGLFRVSLLPHPPPLSDGNLHPAALLRMRGNNFRLYLSISACTIQMQHNNENSYIIHYPSKNVYSGN